MFSQLSVAHLQSEDAAYDYVEARLWPDGPVCPHCGAFGDQVGRLKGKTSRPGMRKCYACRETFTVKMGTIFESSHLPLRLWLQAIYLICSSKKGISTRQLQRTLGVGMKTAWHLSHRIREIMKPNIAGPLGGDGQTLEADETFVGRKAGTKVRRGTSHKLAVFSLVERDGRVRSFHVPNVKGETLRAVLDKHASAASHFMTDDAATYNLIGWNFPSHGIVKHSFGEYVRYLKADERAEGQPRKVHTNTIEGFFSIMKRGIYGVYQHVSEAHLNRYLVEFDFRYCNREALGVDDVARAEIALKRARGKRLTYRTTRGSGPAQASAN